MTIRLYDFYASPNCQRVKVMLYEKNLSYETIPIDIRRGEQKVPEFLNLNPYGKVPVLVDDQTVLRESCIINEYLEERYPDPPLMPKDPSHRAQVRMLLDYGLNYIDAPYWRIRGEFMNKERQLDSAIVNETRTVLRHHLRYLETELGDKTYFMGEFTIVDIGLIPRFLRMESFGVLPFDSLPALGAWLQKVKSRPSVKANL